MVPALTNGGPSFKGAALYYLHDKRQAGETERLTTDRVAWTHTLNLPTDDPEKAWRMMATTAMKSAELKAAAGVKATGRKMTKPALAYSLSWHPDETPTQAEQIEAARETLKRLGLSEHQAVIVSHQDEPHAHVHVIVNRVHPSDGKAATLSKSKLILSQWAQEYEQQRGEIRCPKRVENNAKRLTDEYTRSARKKRTTFELDQAADDSLSTEMLRTDQKQQDAQLAQTQRTMHDNHGRQWTELKRSYHAGKGRIEEGAKKRQQDHETEIKAAFKPRWGELFKQQREARRVFEQRERSGLGTLFNLFTAASETRQHGNKGLTVLGVLAMAFSRQKREQALERKHERERKALARAASKAIGQGSRGIQREAKQEKAALLAAFLKQGAELKELQCKEREAIKLAWTKRNADRKAAFGPLQERAAEWAALEAIGRKSRQQTQGLAPAMYLGRELRRN